MTETVGRQIAIVIDLNKCMGCQTCTVACKVLRTNGPGMERVWWMKVNTIPGRGYPRDWEKMGGGFDTEGRAVPGRSPAPDEYGEAPKLPYERVFFAGAGSTEHLSPLRPQTWGPNWDEDMGAGTYPNSYFFYLPRLCNHCSRPACLEACPHDAITKEDDGRVVIDRSMCPTCSDPVCVSACPYKEITYDAVRRVAWKCDLCVDRLSEGVGPACVRQCPGRAMWIGDLEDPDAAVHKLVRQWKVALPLHPEFGTSGNIYYVPPLTPPAVKDGDIDTLNERLPREELRRLFGSGVDEALAVLERERELRATGESELMDLLIAPRWEALLGEWRKDPSEVARVRGDAT